MRGHTILVVVIVALLGAVACAGDGSDPADEARGSTQPEQGSTDPSPAASTEDALTETDGAGTPPPAPHRSAIRRGCHPGQIPQRYRVRVVCEPYVVRGRSLEELGRQIARGAVDPNDNAYVAATTEWYVAWTYGFAASAAGCKIGFTSLSLTFTFVVPEWKAPKARSDAVVDEWNRFYTALWRHERGHVRVAVRAAREIERFLAELDAAPDCERLDARADAGCQRIMRMARARERTYDRATVHGKTQGAFLES